MKSRSHSVIIRVRFDKPCAKAMAVAAVKDSIWGEFYPVHMEEIPRQLLRAVDNPSKFTVRSVRGHK